MKGRSRHAGTFRRVGRGRIGGSLAAPSDRSGRLGFTLIETIVAIGAVALIAVGLASIFDAVGKTVKGGKRVSLLNQYSTLVENQMRKDFARMTRDGFLLIRHEWADGDGNGRFDPARDAIPLHPDDVAPRARRIDQILFFANGRFETARQPVHPDVRVTSDTAMIYYGHGQRRRVDAGPYLQPRLDDANDNALESRLGRLPAGEPASANPNYHPSEWTLARHATLLVKPSSSGIIRVPDAVRFGPTALDPEDDRERLRLRDYEYQVGLQPAARSVFRSLNRFYPRTSNGAVPRPEFSFRPEVQRATLSSGLVDVASTDLREVRSMVEGLGLYLPEAFDPRSASTFELESLYAPWEWVDPNAPASPGAPSSLDMMHVWMQEAFPTQGGAGPAFGSTGADARRDDPWGVRMRVEPAPIDLLSSLSGPDLESTLERMDKMMLAGNGFLPRCSEFIVEWSFGLVDPVTKQTIWYGPEARYDSNRDGIVNGDDDFSSRAYPANVLNRAGTRVPYAVEVPRLPVLLLVDDCPQPPAPAPPRPPPAWMDESNLPRAAKVWRHEVPSKLIYGRNPIDNRYEPSEALLTTTAHFGYSDPTFKQDRLRWVGRPRGFFPADPSRDPGDGADGVADYGRQIDLDCDGVIESGEVLGGEPLGTSVPWAWPWPKLVRVTMTVSDAQDPSIENTFQFIFGVPPDPVVKIQS